MRIYFKNTYFWIVLLTILLSPEAFGEKVIEAKKWQDRSVTTLPNLDDWSALERK